MARAGTTFEPAPTTCDDACFWLYSSGSTGTPKGTVHMHSSLIQTAELYARPVLGIREDDVVFSAAKLFFAYGLGNALTFPLSVGATTMLDGRAADAGSRCSSACKEQRPTIFYGVPTLYAALLASPELPKKEEVALRVCTSAGEALPADIGERWTRHFGVEILDGIGSTEMLHIFISNRPGEVRYGTTGKPVPGYRIRLAGEDGMEVGPGRDRRAADQRTDQRLPVTGTTATRRRRLSSAPGRAPATSTASTRTATTPTRAAPTTCSR